MSNLAPLLLRWKTLAGLPKRPLASYKGDFGHVLLYGGASGMGGALALAAWAAYRSGAGLVTAACHPDSRAHLAAWAPEAMAQDWPAKLSAWDRPGVVLALGPGLGIHPFNNSMARLQIPQVWDADALNQLAVRGADWLAEAPTRFFTPHPGEAARLLGVATQAVQADRAQAAQNIAQRYRCICILKGHQTLISNGRRLAQCNLGNPGMATGGMGDVLTGILAALLAQGMAPWQAACFGVCLHARAGDLAAQKVGQTSLMARDVIEALPQALLEPKFGH